jgi:hypothetical protein
MLHESAQWFGSTPPFETMGSQQQRPEASSPVILSVLMAKEAKAQQFDSNTNEE